MRDFEGTEAPEPRKWVYGVGRRFRGSEPLDFDGDGREEQLLVESEVQRDRSVDLITHRTSDELFCWFRTRLEIRDSGGRLLYSDRWSINFDDMPVLVGVYAASSPDDYFARFGHLKGMFGTGAENVAASEQIVELDVARWSLRSQGLDESIGEKALGELTNLAEMRVFSYSGDWKEDIRVAVYVPSLRRGVMVQRGYSR